MPSIKSELTKYLNQTLWPGIDGKLKVAGVTLQINSESDLERFVQLGAEGDRTLLRVLGYGITDVEDHPTEVTIIGHRQFKPDYVLKREQKALVVIDLKAPTQSLNDSRWMGQLRSYYREKNVPFGLLFNGEDARLFINTNYEQLRRFEEHFSEEPVLSANRHDSKRMVELLTNLSCHLLDKGALKLAERLAKARLREIEQDVANKHRHEELKELVQQIKSNPSDDVLVAIQNVDENLQAFHPQPSLEELRIVWSESNIDSNRSAQSDSNSPNGRLNPAVRAKVAHLCAKRGWDEGWARTIRGLSYNLDGVKEKGFYPLPLTPGVPDGLCIRFVQGSTAKKIIEQLDVLIQMED